MFVEKSKALLSGEKFREKFLTSRVSLNSKEKEGRREGGDGGDRRKEEEGDASLLSLSLDFSLSFAFAAVEEHFVVKASLLQSKGIHKLRKQLKLKGQKAVFPEDVTTVSHVMYSINSLAHAPPGAPLSSFYQMTASRSLFPSVPKGLIMRVFHELNTVTSLPALLGFEYKKHFRSMAAAGERKHELAIAIAVALYQITCGIIKVIVLRCKCAYLDTTGGISFRWKERRHVGMGVNVSAVNYYFCALDWIASQVRWI